MKWVRDNKREAINYIKSLPNSIGRLFSFNTKQMLSPNNYDPDTFGDAPIQPPKRRSPNNGGGGGVLLGIGSIVNGVFGNANEVAGIFSEDVRDNNLAIAQAQANAYQNANAMQRTPQRKNYTTHIMVAVVIIIALYFLMNSKK